MKTKFFFFVLLSIILGRQNAFSQNIEVNTFQKVCSQLFELNHNWMNKQRLKDITILDNASNGEKVLDYKVETPEIIRFNKFQKKEQQEILSAKKLPIFPLKDTVYISDKNGLFSKDLHWIVNGTYFTSKVKLINSLNITTVNVNGFAFRDKNLIISFSYPNSDLITNIYFAILNNELVVERTSTFNPNKMDW